MSHRPSWSLKPKFVSSVTTPYLRALLLKQYIVENASPSKSHDNIHEASIEY